MKTIHIWTFLAVCIFRSTSCGVCKHCLHLTPFIQNGNIDIARNLSKVYLPGFNNIESYSGFITVDEKFDSHLFFWYFPASESDRPISETPWIIWLQGGPGMSSLIGTFVLHGPIYYNLINDTVGLRDISWTKKYSVLYIDNPVGTGFSHTGDENGFTKNMDDVGGHLINFLQQFLKIFPELRRAPLFVAGQSYGGKYVPTFGIFIHNYNKNNGNPINLRGLSIGNGLIDSPSMLHYDDLTESLGFLDDGQVNEVKVLQQNVTDLIEMGEFYNAEIAFNTTIEYVRATTGVNIYNFEAGPNDYKHNFDFLNYLNKTEVREALHVGDAFYDVNNQTVVEKLRADFVNTTQMFIEELLEHYAVMCYSGQLDIILPYYASTFMFKKMNWSGQSTYQNAVRQKISESNSTRIDGYLKSGGNFTDALILRAGHMVPLDQPQAAFNLIDQFIQKYK